jgi:hypothetical protein
MAVDGIDADLAPASAYPSQREAAEMIGISESALSRSEVQAIQAGRGRHYRPTDVLDLTAHYRQRTLNEVAGMLIARAEQCGDDAAARVRDDIENYFAALQPPEVDRSLFLEEARRTLPRRLYEQVLRAYEDGSVESIEAQYADTSAHVAATS